MSDAPEIYRVPILDGSCYDPGTFSSRPGISSLEINFHPHSFLTISKSQKPKSQKQQKSNPFAVKQREKPNLKFKEFDQRIQENQYDKLLIKGVHEHFYLYLIQGEKTYIYCGDNDQYNIYRHAEQILAWLKSKYGISKIEVDIEACSRHG